MWETHFTVRGGGEFPLDMLRYDGCFPKDSDAIRAISLIHHDSVVDRATKAPRDVELIRYHAYKNDANLTPRRWESFCWQITTTETPRKR